MDFRTIVFIFLLCAVSCRRAETDQKIAELNRELERADEYLRAFNSKADSLKAITFSTDTNLSDSIKWEACYLLFSSYLNLNLDSAVLFCTELERLAANEDLRERTKVCALNCFKNNANETIPDKNTFDASKVSDSFISEYYYHLNRFTGGFNDSLSLSVMNEAVASGKMNPGEEARMKGFRYRVKGDFKQASENFLIAYDKASSYRIKASAAYNLALCYKTMQNKDKVIYWLAESAICDIKTPCKEYASLRELAMELAQQNRYILASRYIQISMDDAIKGQWRNNIEKCSTILSYISDTLSHTLSIIVYLFIIFVFFFVLVLILCMNLIKQKKALDRTNNTIREMNEKLTDEGNIKEAYLFRYMALSVKYLSGVETYKHDLRKTMKEEGMDAMVKKLRQPERNDVYKDFYKKFDTTFNEIYPDFIGKVNQLLKKEAHFSEGIPFSTDLRILATIRLGFTNSSQIAAFLNVPVTSIYSRRSALRRSALCDKDFLEDNIRKIV